MTGDKFILDITEKCLRLDLKNIPKANSNLLLLLSDEEKVIVNNQIDLRKLYTKQILRIKTLLCWEYG